MRNQLLHTVERGLDDLGRACLARELEWVPEVVSINELAVVGRVAVDKLLGGRKKHLHVCLCVCGVLPWTT